MLGIFIKINNKNKNKIDNYKPKQNNFVVVLLSCREKRGDRLSLI